MGILCLIDDLFALLLWRRVCLHHKLHRGLLKAPRGSLPLLFNGSNSKIELFLKVKSIIWNSICLVVVVVILETTVSIC